ncbi:MAG: TIGR04141 family sporadically distributed protein [Tomitella sp.]|nr:TIGR04141 family sporadically distributed protein [Tomitella sp.]
MAVDDDLYAYTAGQSAVVFERFADIAFPIDVGRRIAKPEVKGARSSQITGTTLASDLHFRDPRRITYAESLDNVWTALSGQIRDAVLDEKELSSIFPGKNKIRLDVTSAVKLGPRIESPQKIIELIKWLAKKAEAKLPADDGWASLDAIKVLNPRKKKDLIAELKEALATKVFLTRDYDNLALSHTDAALYDNATSYTASQGKDVVYSSGSRPDLGDIVDSMKVDKTDVVKNLTAVTIETENTDYGANYGTSGPLANHLYGEITHKSGTYFLLAGKWYQVDATYIDQVTKDCSAIMADLDLDPATIAMRKWKASESEGKYNKSSITAATIINGDRILTDNVELFDGLASDGKTTYIVHVKDGFDVKVRDVRSQVINSAQMIENDLRIGTRAKLKAHHAALTRNKRTKLSEQDFLNLFDKPRVYVLAYGTKVKVDEKTLKTFGSSVARMEIVALNSQFRQLSSSQSRAQLKIAWIEVTA